MAELNAPENLNQSVGLEVAVSTYERSFSKLFGAGEEYRLNSPTREKLRDVVASRLDVVKAQERLWERTGKKGLVIDPKHQQELNKWEKSLLFIDGKGRNPETLLTAVEDLADEAKARAGSMFTGREGFFNRLWLGGEQQDQERSRYRYGIDRAKEVVAWVRDNHSQWVAKTEKPLTV